MVAKDASYALAILVGSPNGAIAHDLGSYPRGRAALYQRSVPYAACHDVCTLDGAAGDLAEAASLAGRESEAAAACERALDAAPERPLGERATNLLHQAALFAARGGDADRAARLATATATASRRDPVVIGPWHAPAAAGDLALMAGELPAAR